jgi:hypothetical protein
VKDEKSQKKEEKGTGKRRSKGEHEKGTDKKKREGKEKKIGER